MKKLLLALLSISLLLSLTACKNKETESNEDIAEENNGLFAEVLSAKTGIYYSSGQDNNWSYENFRKEFSSGESCYVRINSKVISNKKIGSSDKVTVIYRFTGVNNCEVEITDGTAVEQKTNNSDVAEYVLTIKSDKASKFDDKDVKETTVVFKYTPKGDGNIVLDVIYEGNIEQSYNQMSKIYFAKEPTESPIENEEPTETTTDVEPITDEDANFEYQVEDQLEEDTAPIEENSSEN